MCCENIFVPHVLQHCTVVGMLYGMTTILDTILENLDARNLSEIEKVSQATGVPFHTIAKIKRRETLNPRIETVQKLLEHFNKSPKAKRKQVA
jgi:transcriptional regulator with XRE-family HTH domain